MNKNYILIGVGIVIVLALGGFMSYQSFTNVGTKVAGELDGFTQCLKDQGAIFYGAFWCPHCQATKKMFGTSAKLLPYVECSTPDGNSQTQNCVEKGITQYPTWKFADDTELTGERTLQELGEKTGCEVPQ